MMDLVPAAAMDELKSMLSPARFEHSRRVLVTCGTLAQAWNFPYAKRESLEWAALFHDCAKEIPREESLRWLQVDGCPFGSELLDTPGLVHAPLGARIVKQRYGITNPDVLRAIAYHATGHRDLTSIGWMVYIADYLEPGRKFVKNRDVLINESCADPLTGLRLVTELRHHLTGAKGRRIHPLALEYRAYLESIERL